MSGERRQIGVHDAQTGEVVDGILVAFSPRRRNGFVEGWAAVALNPAKVIAQHKRELGEDGLALAWVLVSSLDYENFISLRQTEIAKVLGMHKQNVGRAMQKLIDLNMVIPGPKVGRTRTFRLNPHFGWRGSAKSHHDALRETTGPTPLANRMKQAGIRGVIEGGTSALPPEMEQHRDQLALPLSGEE